MKKTIPDKIGKKTFRVFDPIFRQRIYVLLNQDQNDYVKFLTKHKVKDVETDKFYFDRISGFSTFVEMGEGEPRMYLIILKEFNWAIFHQGTLLHEIVHIVIKIFDANNIPFNADTQEFIAHSVARLFEDIAYKLLVKKK